MPDTENNAPDAEQHQADQRTLDRLSIVTTGGTGPTRRDVTPDHPAGRAVDVMIPSYKTNSALGWEIAKYYRANAKAYNINYIIFGQKIWNIARDSEGWRSMADRGGDTANHYDHVHINTYG